MELKKKIALIAAGSIVSAGSVFAFVSVANAATPDAPSVSAPAVDTGTMDMNDANDPADAHEANDPADAHEANDPADAHEANDPADAHEANDPADAHEANDPADAN